MAPSLALTEDQFTKSELMNRLLEGYSREFRLATELAHARARIRELENTAKPEPAGVAPTTTTTS